MRRLLIILYRGRFVHTVIAVELGVGAADETRSRSRRAPYWQVLRDAGREAQVERKSCVSSPRPCSISSPHASLYYTAGDKAPLSELLDSFSRLVTRSLHDHITIMEVAVSRDRSLAPSLQGLWGKVMQAGGAWCRMAAEWSADLSIMQAIS